MEQLHSPVRQEKEDPFSLVRKECLLMAAAPVVANVFDREPALQANPERNSFLVKQKELLGNLRQLVDF